MAGSSGATVEPYVYHGRGIALETVIKRGDERVGEQARWLEARITTSVPYVFERDDTSYVMERLIELQGHTSELVYRRLKKGIWREHRLAPDIKLVEFDPEALQSRLMAALYHVDYELRVAHRLPDLVSDAVMMLDHLMQYSDPTLIHGDPTMENAMYRRGEREGLVLIDPLPARPYAPDLIEVDLGKIGQSLVGFESDRYQGSPIDINIMRNWLFYVCDAEGIPHESVLWWTVAHLIRTFPYVDKATISRILNNSLKHTRDLISEARDARHL